MIDVIANPSDQPNQQLVFTLSRNDFNAVILESKNCSGFRINYNQNNQGTIRIDKVLFYMFIKNRRLLFLKF